MKNTPGNTLGLTYFGLQNGFEYSRRETIFTSRPPHVPRNKDWTQAEIEFDKLNDFDSMSKKLPWMLQERYAHVDGEPTKYMDHVLINASPEHHRSDQNDALPRL